MKDLFKTLITQDHIESLIRSGLKIAGTWLVTHGILAAGSEAEFGAGLVVGLTGFLMSYIDKWEGVKATTDIAKLGPPTPLPFITGMSQVPGSYVPTQQQQAVGLNQPIKNS